MKLNLKEIKNVQEIARRIERGDFPETKELLKKSTSTGWSVAHELARHSNITGWETSDKEILTSKDVNDWSVAHLLAWHHQTWTTDDPKILGLRNKDGESVEDFLNIKYK